MRKIELKKKNFILKDTISTVIEKHVTQFGTGAKVDCPKEYIGRRVYLLVCERNS
jgi:putative transposon-encoded protein